jgi:soluble lytic murein transglycosylase
MPKGKSASAIIALAALVLDMAIGLMPIAALGASAYRSSPSARATADVQVSTGIGHESVASIAVDRGNATVTASIPPKLELVPEAAPAGDGDISALKAGLDALSAGDVAGARLYRIKLPDDSLDRHILSWAIALSGNPDVSSSEIAAAAQALAHWPGAEALEANRERALYREKPDPQTVIRDFAGRAPATTLGTKLLARAYLATGDVDQARAVLSLFWRTQRLDASDETSIIKEFGALIPAADHRFRMERMLYGERVKSALRTAALAEGRELADAWAAVLRGDRGAGKLLDAVPAAQRSAGYFYAKAKYLRRKKDFEGAARAMLEAPGDAAAFADPDEWWVERRVLSRELVDRGDLKTAYKIVAAHSGGKVSSIVDAEFHAGWFALRGLNDPELAAPHFADMAKVADGPIGLSRAYYWLGRTAEAGGSGDAVTYYRRAARYGTAFYGQLAAARLGLQAISIDDPSPDESDLKNFGGREAVRAIRRLEQSGYQARADILYRALAEQLHSPGELALLAALAEARGDHFLALRVGKIAANRGLAIGALSHPVGVIPASADISGTGQALAYAVARQESEFKIGAVSGAGALGLLQLLPGTAKDMAKKNGLPYARERLTTDAGYNATLGSAFLSDQLARFDGSYVLTFVAYNAGPGRANQWVKKYGDPRGKKLEQVIDWIERIPFTETRGYVQRVMENYQVYKMRLSGRFEIADDLVDGR